MGNCETCENVDKRGNVNVMLVSEKNTSHPFTVAPDDLPAYCNEAVKDAYTKLGPF